jgi:hypothetical protein
MASDKAGTYLASVWQCSEAEAFNIALRLMKAGRFHFHLHQWTYTFEFSPETLNVTDRDLKAHASKEVPRVLEAIEKYDPNAPVNDDEPWLDDRYNRSPVIALFVAFGKLVVRDFELYPAPRGN